jgi:hypothetical protein
MARSSTLTPHRSLWRRVRAALTGAAASDAPLVLVATRMPVSPEEQRVAGLLARLPVRTRSALAGVLADDLRLAEKDPFRGAAEVGYWRLALYQRSAEELVSSLVGDFLAEVPRHL